MLARRAGIRRRGLEAILFKANSSRALAGQLVSLAMGQLDLRAARQGDVAMVSCSQATSRPSRSRVSPLARLVGSWNTLTP